MLNFEQAWNVMQAANMGLLGGVSAAHAARGEFGGNLFAAQVAAWVRGAVVARYSAGEIVGRALFHRGVLQGMDSARSLAEKYEARNRLKGK